MVNHSLLLGLPGEDLIRQGLEDHSQKKRTLFSLLVVIAGPRLVEAGLLQSYEQESVEAEILLYQLLQKGGDAFSRYQSLLKELISFENALDHRLARESGEGGRVEKC
jgi:hypothetical protein